MAAILLGMPWLDAFDIDTQTQPPHRELRKPVEGIAAGEGHAIIGSNRPEAIRINPTRRRETMFGEVAERLNALVLKTSKGL